VLGRDHSRPTTLALLALGGLFPSGAVIAQSLFNPVSRDGSGLMFIRISGGGAGIGPPPSSSEVASSTPSTTANQDQHPPRYGGCGSRARKAVVRRASDPTPRPPGAHIVAQSPSTVHLAMAVTSRGRLAHILATNACCTVRRKNKLSW
jgi:hypothetical protein